MAGSAGCWPGEQIFKGGATFQREPFSGVVNVDGVAGPKTLAAILHFQTVSRKLGVAISTDGRVDPPVGEQTLGSISHLPYTIIRLNQAYSSARPSDLPRLARTADCPNELRELLKEPLFVK